MPTRFMPAIALATGIASLMAFTQSGPASAQVGAGVSGAAGAASGAA